MLFGNPSRFAIAWEIVDVWSNTAIKNGLFGLYVNFNLLGNRSGIVHAIGANLCDIAERAKRHETQKVLPDYLSKSSPAEIFDWLCSYTYPKEDHGQDSSWEYLAAPYATYDDGDVLFLVKVSDQDHLYYGRCDGGFYGTIDLPVGEYASVVRDAFETFKD